MDRLPNGDQPGIKTSIRTSLDSFRATLLLPTSSELRKLPKNTTPLHATIHPSWLLYIKPGNLLPYTTNSYATLAKASTANNPTNKRPVIHIPETLPIPDTINSAPFHIVEISGHKILLHQTIDNVNQKKNRSPLGQAPLPSHRQWPYTGAPQTM